MSEVLEVMTAASIGDVVHLKSGSPPLTVFAVEIYNGVTMANVAWFAGDVLRRDAFTIAELFRVGPAIPMPGLPNPMPKCGCLPGNICMSAACPHASKITCMVGDSRGTFTFEEWQKMPPEVPQPITWRDWVR